VYTITIQHSLPGDDKSLVEVFRETSLLFRALGRRAFVAAELSEYVKRLATSGPSAGFEESIEGATSAQRTLERLKGKAHTGVHIADVH
jgi:hypothetical protein